MSRDKLGILFDKRKMDKNIDNNNGSPTGFRVFRWRFFLHKNIIQLSKFFFFLRDTASRID